jgi:integral membrane sensor domain MASE1
VALSYFVVARLSLALLEPVDGVAVFWPAAGVASGILIALGSAARWPVVVGVLAATIAANLLGDRNIWSSVFFAVANAGEAVIVAGLIHRVYGSPFELNELQRYWHSLPRPLLERASRALRVRQALSCFTGRPRPRR